MISSGFVPLVPLLICWQKLSPCPSAMPATTYCEDHTPSKSSGLILEVLMCLNFPPDLGHLLPHISLKDTFISWESPFSRAHKYHVEFTTSLSNSPHDNLLNFRFLKFLTDFWLKLTVDRLWEVWLLFSQLHFDFLSCYLLLHHWLPFVSKPISFYFQTSLLGPGALLPHEPFPRWVTAEASTESPTHPLNSEAPKHQTQKRCVLLSPSPPSGNRGTEFSEAHCAFSLSKTKITQQQEMKTNTPERKTRNCLITSPVTAKAFPFCTLASLSAIFIWVLWFL